MKKFYLATLTLSCAMALAACGGGAGSKNTATTAAATEAAKEEETEAETETETEAEAEAETEAATEAAAPADLLPGVLADFTAEATKPIQDEYNPDGDMVDLGHKYAYCFYDWNGDGTDEIFYLKEQSASDGVTILDGTITAFVGSSNDPVSTSGTISREYIEDIAEVELVGWIDIDPEDGNQELIVSAKKNDGTEQTIFFNSKYAHMNESFSQTKVYDGAFKSWENGILTIGDVEYGIKEGYQLFKPVDELES